MKQWTVDMVTESRTELREEWAEAHKNWVTWEKFYNKKHEIRYVSPAVPRKLATARSKIGAMVDTLVTRVPHVERRTRRPGINAQKRSDNLANWSAALLDTITTQSLVIPPFRQGAENLALYGYCNSVTRWDENNPDFPFLIEFPHPARILMPPLERRPAMAIETMTMHGYQVERMLKEEEFAKVSEDLHAKPFDSLQVISAWNDEWKFLMVEGREAYSLANGFKFMPYTQGYAGFGHELSPEYNESTSGGSLGSKPEDMAIGLLAFVTDSITTMDEYYTAMLALSLKAIYKHYVTTEDAEDMAEQIKEAGLAGVVEIREDGSLKWEDSPNVSPFVNLVNELARSDIDQGTFAGEVQGQRSPGVETATQHAMMLGTARMKFDMPLQQLNYQAQENVAFCARMQEARDEYITIENFTVKKGDFEDDYRLKIDFREKDEAQQLRLKESGIREVQAGLLDFTTYQEENAGRQDSSQMRRRVQRDEIMKSDIITQTIAEAADAAFRAKNKMPPRPQPEQGQNGQQPLVPQPGGDIQAQQGFQGMTNTPGEGVQRVLPQ